MNFRQPFRFLPQRGVRTKLFAPAPRELPAGRMCQLVFDFPLLAPLQVGKFKINIVADTLLWAITGMGSSASIAGPLAGPYRVQFFHEHMGEQRQLFDRHELDANEIGTAQQPMLLKETYPLVRGDSILAEVKSLDPLNNETVQIVLWGIELGTEGE